MEALRFRGPPTRRRLDLLAKPNLSVAIQVCRLASHPHPSDNPANLYHEIVPYPHFNSRSLARDASLHH